MLTEQPARQDTTPVRDQLLSFLFRHRAADTNQLHAMLGPGRHLRYTRRCLRELRAEGLVESSVRAHHCSVWALSRHGISQIGAWPEFRAQRVRALSPASVRHAHTLAVTRSALAFLHDARAREDEFSPLDWQPEVAHPLRDGTADGERMLIADAVMRYTRTAPTRALLRAFIEVDRATESPERLARKLITYARFHSARPLPRRGAAAADGLPQWQRSYPRFPRVLFLLTNAGPRALAQRVSDLQAMARQHPLVSSFAAEVPLGVALLEEVEEAGASGPVWTSLTHTPGGKRSWMNL
ncbi:MULTISPECIES: replication-relaxation family protein [unclassified Streptomyces]|uniref:replication-relaxation family protein n=1 Tax=unclassified Streptomyces TaxID=2593676 RepID=UPI002DDB09F6|nr:replication-relaxation family protein [Streptomyces sp. NBC_01795]WSA97762.1 replication-relaxation family protein [Streptomyces sp. NBC_01795]WSS46721.1 replication-relaxation family protein [Streptomyces sp. NBC_01187]WSS47062.1 replication-relaxation family protein [Streptomyces sp. NBC_01187]